MWRMLCGEGGSLCIFWGVFANVWGGVRVRFLNLGEVPMYYLGGGILLRMQSNFNLLYLYIFPFFKSWKCWYTIKNVWNWRPKFWKFISKNPCLVWRAFVQSCHLGSGGLNTPQHPFCPCVIGHWWMIFTAHHLDAPTDEARGKTWLPLLTRSWWRTCWEQGSSSFSQTEDHSLPKCRLRARCDRDTHCSTVS